MDETFSFRTYTPLDYEQMKGLLEECELFYEPMDAAERLEEKITRDPESIIVAISGERIVGTVSIMEDGRTPFIFRLGVAVSHRNQGLGKRLMGMAEEELVNRGYEKPNILVDEQDPKLQGYYERQNYERGNLWRWMEKR